MRELLFTLTLGGIHTDWYVYADYSLHGWYLDKFVGVDDSGDYFTVDRNHPNWSQIVCDFRYTQAYDIIDELMRE